MGLSLFYLFVNDPWRRPQTPDEKRAMPGVIRCLLRSPRSSACALVLRQIPAELPWLAHRMHERTAPSESAVRERRASGNPGRTPGLNNVPTAGYSS